MKDVWLNPRFANCNAPVALFADRDGTLIEHVHYVSDPEAIHLLPGVKETVRMLAGARIPLFILTNQSGVGRGYFPVEQVHACQRRLFELMGITAADLAGWCIAPEAPGVGGGYRKPSPRFIHEACDFLDVPPGRCHVIGDTLADLETAWNADATAWAVACGKPELPEAHAARTIDGGAYKLQPDFPACVRAILASPHEC